MSDIREELRTSTVLVSFFFWKSGWRTASPYTWYMLAYATMPLGCR